MDEELEQTLLIVKECFVYRIPPRTKAAAYKAGEWDLNTPMWTGRLVVTAKGANCVIKLVDPNSGELFAICPVDETSVEPVADSSRYYVIRIEDGSGRRAFIGLGFTERNEAFDFNSALQDHKRYVKQEKDAQEALNRLDTEPKKDYSLPEGTKITIDLKINKAPSEKPKSSTSQGLGGLLPPPPSAKRTTPLAAPPTSFQPAQQSFQPAQQQQFGNFNFGNTSQPQQSTSNDLWSDFGNFSSTPNQQPNQQQQQQQNSANWFNF